MSQVLGLNSYAEVLEVKESTNGFLHNSVYLILHMVFHETHIPKCLMQVLKLIVEGGEKSRIAEN